MRSPKEFWLQTERVKRFLSQKEEYQSQALMLRPITLITFAAWFILGIFAWTPGVGDWPDYFSRGGLLLVVIFAFVLLFTVHETIFLARVFGARKAQ